MNTVLGIILLVASVFLTVAVLMQSGKAHNLSGSIAGGADTFFGKTKGKTIDKMLSKVTTIVAILFAILVLVVYIIQPETVNGSEEEIANDDAVQTEEVVEEQIADDTGAVAID